MQDIRDERPGWSIATVAGVLLGSGSHSLFDVGEEGKRVGFGG